ncbi:MAG: hypothetical protein GW938_00720 [Leptospira sp.]|nr:hypothetical protein [Leptospira sp.]
MPEFERESNIKIAKASLNDRIAFSDIWGIMEPHPMDMTRTIRSIG